METRVAVMGIIVQNTASVETLNSLLHEYGQYIIGRMGIPYREKDIYVMSIAIDAPQDIISALSGKVGSLAGVSVKTAYSNITSSTVKGRWFPTALYLYLLLFVKSGSAFTAAVYHFYSVSQSVNHCI